MLTREIPVQLYESPNTVLRYVFSVSVPKSLRCMSDRPPAHYDDNGVTSVIPDHGFRVYRDDPLFRWGIQWPFQDYGRDPNLLQAADMPTSVNSVNYLRKRAHDLTVTCDGIDSHYSYLPPDNLWGEYHISASPPPEPTNTAHGGEHESTQARQPWTPARRGIIPPTPAPPAS